MGGTDLPGCDVHGSWVLDGFLSPAPGERIEVRGAGDYDYDYDYDKDCD
jgi:hypothetical protein